MVMVMLVMLVVLAVLVIGVVMVVAWCWWLRGGDKIFVRKNYGGHLARLQVVVARVICRPKN